MPTPRKGPRLGGSPSHQKAILANLATSLFEHGSITTTETKARVLRPYAEKLITKAKRGDLHNRRQVMSLIRDKTVVHTLFTEIGPRYLERPGGYTRITKIGPRKGDNAPMAVIALVEEEYTATARSTTPSEPATKTAAPAEPEVEETTDTTATEEPDTSSESAEAEIEQVEAQDAVADQEPEGETPGATDEAETSEASGDDSGDEAAADESDEDESK